MALTSGERAALWRKRQKEDPERHAKYKAKERQRYKRRREEGSLKSINEMNEREKRKTRRNWRKNQRSKRENDAMLMKHVQQQLSPPNSPTDNTENIQPKKRGRKRTRKENSKAYRDLFQLRVKFNCERRLKEKYKKRAYRLSKKDKTDIENEVDKKLKSKEINKALILHMIMIRNIKAMNINGRKNGKNLIREMFCRDKILRKYKLGRYAQRVLNMKINQSSKRQIKQKQPLWIKTVVVEYFERDDNSRIMGGKKCTITRHGLKKQIRLLNDTIKNIHEKFLCEQKSKISYSLFCKLKPFYVIKPKEKHRETCLCKHHENIQFKINRIFQEKAIETNNIDDLLKNITCDVDKKACMYRECENCSTKTLRFKHVDGRQVFWYSWKNVRIEKEKKNDNGTVEKKKIVKTIKQKEFGTLENLTIELQNDLKRIGRHVYNIKHQYQAIRKLKDTLEDNDAIVHIDFSENYSCKCRSEIQGMHFGASQRQITLHTGMVYYKNSSQSFTTLSDCMYHGPTAIWAHIKPILKNIKQQNDIDVIHFVSDGPTTQYRSKTNFYMLSKLIFELGFKSATWNFWEAGHGKGAPDGIGSCIKRLADSLVLHNKQDVTNAAELLEGLTKLDTKIDMYEVAQTEIDSFNHYTDVKIKPVPETMKIHQIVVTEPCTIYSRPLSCFCRWNCDCYNPIKTCFVDKKTPQVIENQENDMINTAEDRDNTIDTAEQNDQSTLMVTNESVLVKLCEVDESVIGRYCVVEYDGRPYPGIILDVDEDDLEVKVMNQIGVNRFFWPLIEDRLWYHKSKVVTMLLRDMQQVTKRHCEIDHLVWKAIVDEMDI